MASTNKIIAAFATTLVTGVAAAQVVPIDEFNDEFPRRLVGDGTVQFETNALVVSSFFPDFSVMDSVSQTGLSVIGGERRATLFANEVTGAGFLDTARIENGTLSMSTRLNPGHTLLLEYGYETDLNFDVDTELGLLELVFNFEVDGDQNGQDADARPFSVRVDLTSNRGESNEATDFIVQDVLENGTYLVDLADFGVDRTDIDSISIEIDVTSQDAVDVEFDGFRFVGGDVIPTPSTMALAGIGGLIAARRRRA